MIFFFFGGGGGGGGIFSGINVVFVFCRPVQSFLEKGGGLQRAKRKKKDLKSDENLNSHIPVYYGFTPLTLPGARFIKTYI